MIQKLRDAMFRASTLPSREDGALSFIQLAALIIGPIVAGSLALGAYSAIRLGGDLGGMFTRDAQMNQMVERMQLQLSNITEMTVEDEHSFTVADQPGKRSAYYVPSSGMPEVCVSNEWTLEEEGTGTLTLRNITYTHAEDSCDSEVARQSERTMTGLAAETYFDYENAYGRDLTFTDGAEAGAKLSVNERPEGLFNNEWEYASPGFVTLTGAMNQAIGSTPLDYTAKTSLKQLRPGVVSSDLGELGPPLIERIARGGDTYRAQMSALTVLNDPRTTIEWSWREVKNVGDTTTSLPSEAQWGDWSSWTTLDHFDSTVLQGSKWQVQAKYRVVIDERSAESEIVTMTWVRPIDKPAAPTVAVALNAGSGAATITVTPAVCAAGTTVNTQIRSSVNDASWSAWAVQAASPYRTTLTLAEGAKLTANGQARCVTKYAESAWAAATTAPDTVRPITSVPTIESVTATVPAPDDRGTAQGALSSCPAGTTYQVRWSYQVNAGSFTNASSKFADSNTRPTVNAAAVREGERFTARLTARCITPYVTTAPTAERTSDPVVNPIRTSPTVTNVVTSVNSSTGVPTVRGTVGSCQPWMTYEGRARSATNAQTGYTPVGSFAAISTSPSWNLTAINQGARFRGGIEARCATSYAKGPSATGDNANWQIRPIVTPVAPTITAVVSGSTGTSTITAATCPAGTTLGYNHRQRTSQAAMGAWSAYTDARTRTLTVQQGGRFEAEGQVRCYSPYTTSAWSATAAANTTRAIATPSAPTITTAISGTNGVSTIGVYTCGAGTTAEYQQRRAVRTENVTISYGTWTASRSVTAPVGEGARLDAQGQVRCTTTWVDSSWSATASANVIRPITDTPTVTSPTASFNGSGNGSVTADLASCGVGLRYQGRIMVRQNAETTWAYGGWTDFAAAGRQTLVSTRTWDQGSRFLGGMDARCITAFAQGPSASASDSNWRVKPITGLFLLTNMRFISVGTEGHLWSDIARVCPAGTTPRWQPFVSRDYQALWASYGGWNTADNNNNVAWNAGYMNEGQRFAGGFNTKCISPYAEGPTSTNSTNGYTVRPITTVPTASVSAGWGTVYFSNPSSCPAGTTFRWRYADRHNNGGWSSWSHTGPTNTWYTNGNQGGFSPRSGYAPYGGTLQASVDVLCRSDFTNGPTRNYAPRSGVRPYPAPSAPGSASGTIFVSCAGNAFTGSGSWSAGSYASSYYVQGSWTMRTGGRQSTNYGTYYGQSAGLARSGISIASNPSYTLTVTSQNSSGSSGRSFGLGRSAGCY
ncbi:MAG: hypothetical protein J0J04_08600 [Microbacterium sp.]|uniref:hypothetical protein n=1 Tax=Microbacterium sp. TaxID=51671 RepID=UPI001ACF6E90|nr:hypothetical protein [Microbacterium sp.]MBN9214836.1 hypothetical protein [Microbacterium sp.]